VDLVVLIEDNKKGCQNIENKAPEIFLTAKRAKGRAEGSDSY